MNMFRKPSITRMLAVSAVLAAIGSSSCSSSGASSAIPSALAHRPAQASRDLHNPLGAASLPMSDAPMLLTGPYHIATYALDIYGFEGGSASAASVNKLLTYAEDGPL